MTKNELVELTKVDMIQEEIPLLEAEDYMPDDVEFKWKVDESSDDFIQVTMEAYAKGEYVNAKSRKIYLLEE